MMTISAKKALTEARITLAEQRIQRLNEDLADLAGAEDENTYGPNPPEWELVAARLANWNDRLRVLRSIHADLTGA